MTTTTASVFSGKIPDPIVRTLRKLIRRRRMVIVVRGLAAVWTVAVASLLAVMAVDATVTLFSSWPRWLLSLSAGAITLSAAIFFLVRPLIRTFSLAGIARLIESRHPELHERISSAVELLSSSDSEEYRGSRFLIEALAREACEDVQAVAPKREVTLAAAKPFFITSGVVLLVLGLLMVIWPKSTTFLLTRALAPYKNLANIQAQDLTVTPGDVTVAAGTRVRVEVGVANTSVRKAYFRRAQDGGADLSEEMTPLTGEVKDSRGFALTLPPAEADFRYRVHAGDAVSRFYDVHVVALPTARSIDIIYDYPAYTQRLPEVQKAVEGDIKAVVGTGLTILMQSDVPLSAAQMLVNGQVYAQGQVSGSGATFKMNLPARLNGRWAVRLVRNANGQDFESFTADHKIESVPDMPPTIKIAQPTATQLRLKPGEHLPISYVASDDVGMASLEILTKIDGRDQPPIALELKGDAPHRLAVETATLDLSKMKLTGAASVTFQLRVRDTLPSDLKGPQEALSELFTIALDVNSQPYAVQVTMAEEVIIRQLLQQLQAELTPAKADSKELMDAMDRANKLYAKAVQEAKAKGLDVADVPQPVFPDSNTQQVDRVRTRMDNSQKLLAQLTEKVAGGTFAAMGEKLTQVEDHVKSGDSFASQVKVVEDAPGRWEKAERTDFHVYHALRIVNDLLGTLHAQSELAQKAQQLESMTNQQDDLAEAKAQMDAAKEKAEKAAASQPAGSPQANADANNNDPSKKPMTDQEWKQKENLLAAQLAAMAKKSPMAVSEEAKRDAEKIKDLSGEARRLAKDETQLAKESDLLTKLAELDQQRKNLAAEQTQLSNETKANKDAQPEANKMADAAKNLEKGDIDKAVGDQKDAQKGLENKAKPSGPNNTATPENSQAAAMAPRQADLNRRTAELNDKVKALQKEMGDQMARLQNEQKQLAKEAGELSDKTKATAPQADETDTKAAMAAKRAADELDANKPADAAKSGQESAKQLEKLAKQLGREAGREELKEQPKPDDSAKDPKDPSKTPDDKKPDDKKPDDKKPDDKKPDNTAQGSTDQQPKQIGDEKAKDKEKLADQAANLAERQKNVAEQIKALAEKNPAELAKAKQKDLSEKTDKLDESLKLVQQHADELIEDPATRQEAAQAAAEMVQAKAQQKAAEANLQAKNLPGAKQNQDVAAAQLDKTAAALDRLGAKLAEAANKKPTPEQTPIAEEPAMDETYDQTRKAAQTEELTDAALAAKMLEELAKQASENAKAKGANPQASAKMSPMKNGMHQPSWSMESKPGMRNQKVDLTPAQLEAMGINLKDWARLPGHLKDEVLQAAEENVPEEYRQLVKHYFQEIARRGGATDKK